jgi:hypothetical protein
MKSKMELINAVTVLPLVTEQQHGLDIIEEELIARATKHRSFERMFSSLGLNDFFSMGKQADEILYGNDEFDCPAFWGHLIKGIQRLYSKIKVEQYVEAELKDKIILKLATRVKELEHRLKTVTDILGE